MLSEILLNHCAILSIVSEAVCCCFNQVSSHLLKFMLYSFHVQSECCQNHIILIHSYLVSTRLISIPSCPLYSTFIALHPSRFTWCSLFLFSTAVLSIVFSSVMSFLSTFQPLKVLGFTRLLKKQLSFTSSLPLPFLFGAILDLGTRSSRSGGVL